MRQSIQKKRGRFISERLGISVLILTGLLLPSFVSAQDTREELLSATQKYCDKITELLGETRVSYVGGLDFTSVDPIARCGDWQKQDLQGYSSRVIDDVKIITNKVKFTRYSTTEATQILAKWRRESNSYPSLTYQETPDGFVYIGKLVILGRALGADVTVGIQRGDCQIEVSGKDVGVEDAVRTKYHYTDPNTHKLVDAHPGFDHVREADILELARQKAKELLNALDCGVVAKEKQTQTTQVAPDENVQEVKTPVEERTPLEQAKVLDGDALRDFVYGLSPDGLHELLTEENKAKIGISRWVKLVKASENIRQLKRDATVLGQRNVNELRLYLESNTLASWERAVVTDVINQITNKTPTLPNADFSSPESPEVEDFRSRTRADYAQEVEKGNEKAGLGNDPTDPAYQKIIQALNSELGVSPLRQWLLDQERGPTKGPLADYDVPDPTYTGVDFEVPYDSTPDRDTALPFVSGRGGNSAPVGFTQVARISNFQGRVIIERTERDGRKTYQQVHRIGTSVRPSVVFEGDRVLVGKDSAVDIMKPNGSENRYAAPNLPAHPAGDEINTTVQTTVIQPPDPKTPPPNPAMRWLRDFFERLVPAKDENYFETPYGINGVKG